MHFKMYSGSSNNDVRTYLFFDKCGLNIKAIFFLITEISEYIYVYIYIYTHHTYIYNIFKNIYIYI